MNNENKILYALARTNFTAEHQMIILNICSKVQIDWNIIFTTALQHKVAPFIYLNLLKCQPEVTTIPEDFKRKIIELSIFRRKQELDIKKVLSRFNQKSIDVMLLKGAALSFTVYKDYPSYIMGDIDLILNNKRQDVTDLEDQDDVNFFQSLAINEWERHQHHDVNINGKIPINFSEIWDRGIKINILGEKAIIMSPEDMLLTACINSCRKRFFRLKSLCDIAEIIYYYQKLDWEKFVELAKKYKCESIVYTSLMVTHQTIGCNLPNNILETFSITKFRKIFIKYLSNYLSKHQPLDSLFSSSNKEILDGERGEVNLFLLLKIMIS